MRLSLKTAPQKSGFAAIIGKIAICFSFLDNAMAHWTTPRSALNLLTGVLLGLGASTSSWGQVATAQGPKEPPTERLSPQVRSQLLPAPLTSAVKRSLIEPFLAQPLVIDEDALREAPRIVAAQENRVLLSRGDRAYVRSAAGSALVLNPEKDQRFGVFRDTKPLRDPVSGAVLGYEAQFVGSAVLVESEGRVSDSAPGAEGAVIMPATVLITGAKEEIRAGDRLLPRLPSRWQELVPHPAAQGLAAQIISVYGSTAVNAGQNQIVVLNRGSSNGVEPGQVLAIQKRLALATDKTGEARTPLQLPDERNGMAMVFLSFDKLAYALVVEVSDAVRVGDRLVSPL
jgi:hypothetical protein